MPVAAVDDTVAVIVKVDSLAEHGAGNSHMKAIRMNFVDSVQVGE
jgi:hypothetical protein